jgi:hypothetical protein
MKPLPKYLTDMPAEEIAEQQKEFKKAVNVPAAQSNDEARVTFAIKREEALRATLEVMYRDNVGGEERQEVKEMLAGALFDQGRFQEARTITRNPEMKERIKEYIGGVEKDDDVWCKCEDGSFADPKETCVIERLIPSFKHEMKLVPAYRCAICQELNISEA